METIIKNAEDAVRLSEQNIKMNIDSVLSQIDGMSKCGNREYRISISGNQNIDNLILSLIQLGFSCKRFETLFCEKLLIIEW